MASKLTRVTSEDDPRRCHGSTRTGQCWNIAVEGTDLCERCSGRELVIENRQSYLLTNPKFRDRLAQLNEADEIKSLREEVNIARMLVEERLNLVKNDGDVAQATGSINSLLLTVEKLRSRSHVLEQNLGQLLQKSTVFQLMQTLVQIVDEEVRSLPGGAEAKDRIVSRLYDAAQNVRNQEQARGVRLLSDDT